MLNDQIFFLLKNQKLKNLNIATTDTGLDNIYQHQKRYNDVRSYLVRFHHDTATVIALTIKLVQKKALSFEHNGFKAKLLENK